jgi:hypothetical protein
MCHFIVNRPPVSKRGNSGACPYKFHTQTAKIHRQSQHGAWYPAEECVDDSAQTKSEVSSMTDYQTDGLAVLVLMMMNFCVGLHVHLT